MEQDIWERIWNEDPNENLWERIWGKEENGKNTHDISTNYRNIHLSVYGS